MATDDSLAHSHFVGPDVLNSWFQDLVARGILPGKAMREIMELLQGGDLRISVRVVGGVRARQRMHFATKEEEEQAREEYRAAVARHDYDAADDAIYGTSPPGGLIGPLSPETWGHKVTLVIRDRHLLIKWLHPTFRPEHCSFAIVNPEVLDRLVAAASPGHTSSAAVGRNAIMPEPPRPPDDADKIEHVRWAIKALQITDPNSLAGIRGKELRNLVCRKIGPNFECAVKTVQRALDEPG